MRVSLIDATGMGTPDPADHAACLLILSKNTRVTMSPGFLESIKAWSPDKKLEELAYIANTIPSSHEFVSYTWLIEDVSRAFTHQFVRSRQFSFAQQTMQTLDMSQGTGWKYYAGPAVEHDQKYHGAMDFIAGAYESMIKNGVPPEEARGILPTHVLTNIVAKCNLRTLVELVRKRAGIRNLGEYRQVLDLMVRVAIDIHPWARMFIEQDDLKAAADLDKEISEISDPLKKVRMLKLVDQMRRKG